MGAHVVRKRERFLIDMSTMSAFYALGFALTPRIYGHSLEILRNVNVLDDWRAVNSA